MTAPDPGRAGTIVSLVGRVLDYMSTPWRAVAVAALILILGVGWAVWSERGELIAAFKNRAPGPIVLKAQLLPEINGLLNDTTADLVAVWSVDLGANVQRRLLDAKRGDGDWAPDLRVLPALSPSSDMPRTVKLLAGHPVCGSTGDKPANLLLRRLASDGYLWVCVVPVPPEAKVLQIGVIYLAWKQIPDPAHVDAAKSAGLAAAENMVMH